MQTSRINVKNRIANMMAIISRRICSMLHREAVIESVSFNNDLVLDTDVLCALKMNETNKEKKNQLNETVE